MTSGSDARRALRVATSLALLAIVAWVVEPGEVLARLSRLDVRWVAAALAVSLAQVVVSAWRWRYTATRLGVALPFGTAVGEYYLATFLNQVLPGGVVGDVSRAWRHHRAEDGSSPLSEEPSAQARTPAPSTSAVHVVILERVSGQVVMLAAAAVAAAVLATAPGTDAPADAGARVAMIAALAAVAGGLGGALIGGMVALNRRRGGGRLDGFLGDARTALLGSALPVQAAVSLLIVASYVAVFVLAARAVGVDASTGLLALTTPPILVAMLIPVSVAGWGLREGAAAALWGIVGLSSADGVAVSVAYGLLVLVSSLPGAVVLLLSPPRSDPGGP